MAFTAKAFYAKFLRGQKPQPSRIAALRVDYDPHSGIPIQTTVVSMLDPDNMEGQPTAQDLERIYPGLTGLCSWTFVALPQAVLAHQPWLVGQTNAQPSLQPVARKRGRPKKTSAQPASPQPANPISIASGQPLPEYSDDAQYDFNPGNYCDFCGYIKGSGHMMECDKYAGQ